MQQFLCPQHGWPGSVREFYDIIPLLTTPKDGIAFEVIAPSLPGYGFSEGAYKQGMGPLKAAVVLRNLMIRIGFDKFYVQGTIASECSEATHIPLVASVLYLRWRLGLDNWLKHGNNFP